jgi:hypothetical protein
MGLRFAIIKLGGMLVVVVLAAVALATALTLARSDGGGDPILGFLIFVACVGCLASTEATRRFDRLRAEGAQQGGKWIILFYSLAFAMVTIGVPDAVFVACYLCLCGGRWGVTFATEEEPQLYQAAIVVASFAAVGVASLLRLLLLPGGRKASGKPTLTRLESAKAD